MKNVFKATALAALLASTLAMAASVHLKPPHRNPTFVDQGLSMQVAGSLAGLGNGDVVISLSAVGNTVATCTNPAGQTQPPGQNPAPSTLTGSQIIPEDAVKNGSVSFNVQTTTATSPIPGAPGCPNPQWTETVVDVAFTSFVLTVEQPATVVVLQLTCTSSVPTVNGTVNPSSIACVVTK